MTDKKEIDFNNRLLGLFDKVQKPNFNKNQQSGNEMRYFIFDYPPEYELKFRDIIDSKVAKNNANEGLIPIVVLDLYDLVIGILEERNYLNRCFQIEKTKGFEHIPKAIEGVLRVSSASSVLIQRIKEQVKPESIVFITGVGKCFPMLRSHNVLNNLHLAFDRNPVIMFYPGEYNGQELALFNKIKDGNYYRAFRFV